MHMHSSVQIYQSVQLTRKVADAFPALPDTLFPQAHFTITAAHSQDVA